MKYATDITDETVSHELDIILKDNIEENSTKGIYNDIIGMLDITTLDTTDNYESVIKLVDKINSLESKHPDIKPFAGICTYPNFVTVVRGELSVSDVKIVSVAGGFPSSQTFTEIKTIETGLAVGDGADEIDIVMNIGNYLAGNYEDLCDEIAEIKEACRGAKLKVILETGALPTAEDIMKASILAIYSGADFIKTSTGKRGIGATPESFYIMCKAVKAYYQETGIMIGVKAAGGIKTGASAVIYYTIVKEVLGEEWLNSNYFRIGAASLADSLIEAITLEDNK